MSAQHVTLESGAQRRGALGVGTQRGLEHARGDESKGTDEVTKARCSAEGECPQVRA